MNDAAITLFTLEDDGSSFRNGIGLRGIAHPAGQEIFPKLIRMSGNGTSAMQIRQLGAEDSLDELTDMLHRAFAPLGAMGLNCTCVDQPVETTRRRVDAGCCFVVEANGKIAGTLTLCDPDPQSPCPSYHAPETASVRQLAVAPEHQGLGLGRQLLLFAENWAHSLGYRRLALDTPLAASHLVSFYLNRGFQAEACQRFPGKNYLSLVMGKDLRVYRTMQACQPPACGNGIASAHYAGSRSEHRANFDTIFTLVG